jgi:Na+-transporting NADH:ubiquinone oxidoreductase subunit NqrB
MKPRFDPRLYQITALTALLIYGISALHFDVTAARSALILGVAIGAQALCSRMWGVRFDPRSAAISGLSLCLLLRSNSVVLVLIAAVIAVGSKFVIRWRGKHIFNPTNVAIVALMLFTPRVWVSPGQWGNLAFFAFLIACLGGLVVNRAARTDVTYAFIAAWCALLIGRSLWLGEPMTIPLHRLENGALLLFTFFMISDPKTTPDSRAGRMLFAAMVALGGAYIQFKLFRTNGILWSLAACSLLVPFIDALLPAERYSWNSHGGSPWSVAYSRLLSLSSAPLLRTPSAASTSPKETPGFSTGPHRSSSSATQIGP